MSSYAGKRTKKEDHAGKRRGRMAVLIILACLVALGLLAAAVYKSVVVKPELGQNRLPGAGDEAVDPEREPVDIDVVEKVDGQRKSKDFYTILVVGTDVASNSTDTIMLVSYDVTNQSATVMSIPRDTLVNTFGTGRYTRINSVYAAYGRGQKGIDALTYEVSELVGFIPDYRMFIKWELVGLMVEAIGGVEFDVPYHMEYDDPAQDLHIYLEKGLQTLNGDQAMQLVRWRKNNAGVSSGGGTGSDINRLQVQQSFLKAVLKQVLQIKNVTRIGELAKLLGENVEGDLTVSNLIWFATSAVMGGLDSDAVEFCTMPVKPEGVYVYPDQEPLLELINTKLNPYREDVTIKQLDLIYVDGNGNLRSTG